MIGSIVLEVVDLARPGLVWRRAVNLPGLPARGDVLTFGPGDGDLYLRVAGTTWDLAALGSDRVFAVVHLTRLRPESWADVDPLLDQHLGRVSDSTPTEKDE